MLKAYKLISDNQENELNPQRMVTVQTIHTFKTLWCIIVKQFEIHLRDLKAKIQCKRKTSAEKTPFVISFLCHVTDEYSILSFSFFLVIVSIFAEFFYIRFVAVWLAGAIF